MERIGKSSIKTSTILLNWTNKLKDDDMGFVYFITDGEFIKIGTTRVDVKKRLKQLNTGSSKQLYLLGYIYGDKKEEKRIHKLFEKDKIRDNGEWFLASDSLIDFINNKNEMKNVCVIKNELMNNYLMTTLKL